MQLASSVAAFFYYSAVLSICMNLISVGAMDRRACKQREKDEFGRAHIRFSYLNWWYRVYFTAIHTFRDVLLSESRFLHGFKVQAPFNMHQS